MRLRMRPDRGSRRVLKAHPFIIRSVIAAGWLGLATGCSQQGLDHEFLAEELSAEVAHQPLVAAIAGWGGDTGYYVNLWNGGLVVDKPLLDVPALGFDWDVGLFYNSVLASEVSMVGAGWRFSYDLELAFDVPAPGSITLTWGDGRRDVFTFDGMRWVPATSLLGAAIETLAGEYHLRTKHGKLYVFDAAGRLARLVDRNGNTWTCTYDGAGNLVQIMDPSGRTLVMAYDPTGLLLQISSLPAAPLQFTYAGTLLVQVRDAAGNPADFTYDGANRMLSAVDATAAAVDVSYHPTVDAVIQVRAGAAERNFDYNPFTLTTTVRDPLDPVRTCKADYTMNADGLVVRVQGPDGVAFSDYDPATLVLTSHTDVNGRTTTRTVDAVGNVTSLTDATGATRSWAYDPIFNFEITAVDAAGNSWTRALDANGNVVAVTNPAGATLAIARTPQGLVQSVTTPRGLVTVYAQDAAGNLTSAMDPSGATVVATYNPRGRPTQITDQLGQNHHFDYNLRDEMIAYTAPRGGRWEMEYTQVGRLRRLTDAAFAAVLLAYNERHQLTSWISAIGGTTTIERDRAGAVLRLVDALGNVETYTRDVLERIIALTDADGGVWSLTPAPGDLQQYATVTDPLGVTEMRSYTPRYELATRDWIGGLHCSYLHDARGFTIHASRIAPLAALVAYDRIHDALGRLVSETAQHLGRTTSYSHDLDGNVIGVTDNLRPAGGITLGFDVRNVAQTVGIVSPPFTTTLTTSQRFELLAVNHSNGVLSNFARDADGNLVSITNMGAGFNADYGIQRDLRGFATHVLGSSPAMAMIDHDLVRDLDGRLRDENFPLLMQGVHYDLDLLRNRTLRAAPPGMPEFYAYSPASRLLSTVAGPIVKTWIWNQAGYVTQATRPGVTMALAYHDDRTLKSIDQNGQLWTFLIGPFGEIVQVTEPAGNAVWFAEDRANGFILRRAEFTVANSAPSNEYIYAPAAAGAAAGHVAALPAVWNRLPYTSITLRAVVAGPQGPAQVASSGGGLVSDVYTDRFGKVIAQTGSVRPRTAHAGMDAFANLDVLLTSPEVRAPACYDPSTGTTYADRAWGPDEDCDPGEAESGVHPAALAGAMYAGEAIAQRAVGFDWTAFMIYPNQTAPPSYFDPEDGWRVLESYYYFRPWERPFEMVWRNRWVAGQARAPGYAGRCIAPVEDDDWPRFLKAPGSDGGRGGSEDPWPIPPYPPRDPVEFDADFATRGLTLEQLRALLLYLGQQAAARRIP